MYGDEETEEIITEDDDVDLFTVDLDYEFDANRFFDFTRPESDSEAEVSQRWFQSAHAYPNSPFIVKFKWREDLYPQNAKASFESNAAKSTISSSDNSCCDTVPNVLDDKREGPKYTKSPSFMKPTASHLAKIKPSTETCSDRSIGRSPSSVTTFSETSSRSALSAYLQATKRQKLDIGFLRKKTLKKSFSMNQVARLKHQNLLLHKLSRDPSFVANRVTSRLKPTIPREPDLETARRAQRHRFRNNQESDDNSKLKSFSFKERPVTKNSLKASQSPTQKKSERQPLASQKLKHPAENGSCCDPPTELFKKLSLKYEERKAAPRTKQFSNKKVSKENVLGSLRREVSVL